MMLNKIFLKDLEISKYKEESKVRMPVNICRFIFDICCQFYFLDIESVKISNENNSVDD